jgi:Fe-S-cluster containining protein
MKPPLIEQVEKIYQQVQATILTLPHLAGKCSACGKCCNFKSFDHLLYVTPPEIQYLAFHIDDENIKPMTGGVCPYNVKGKCTVYDYRFCCCRIFCCEGDRDFQSMLTEATLARLKNLCEQFHIPYKYMELSAVLK